MASIGLRRLTLGVAIVTVATHGCGGSDTPSGPTPTNHDDPSSSNLHGRILIR